MMEVEIITPTIEEITSSSKLISCPYKRCNGLQIYRPHWSKHMKNFHADDVLNKTKTYLCPIKNCLHSRSAGDGFQTMLLLKQHYRKNHIVYSCNKCGKRQFKSKDAAREHEESCGVKFVCSCDIAFSTLRSLQRHALKQNHTLPESIVAKIESKKRKRIPGTLVKPAAAAVKKLSSLKSQQEKLILPNTLKSRTKCFRILNSDKGNKAVNQQLPFTVVCPPGVDPSCSIQTYIPVINQSVGTNISDQVLGTLPITTKHNTNNSNSIPHASVASTQLWSHLNAAQFSRSGSMATTTAIQSSSNSTQTMNPSSSGGPATIVFDRNVSTTTCQTSSQNHASMMTDFSSIPCQSTTPQTNCNASCQTPLNGEGLVRRDSSFNDIAAADCSVMTEEEKFLEDISTQTTFISTSSPQKHRVPSSTSLDKISSICQTEERDDFLAASYSSELSALLGTDVSCQTATNFQHNLSNICNNFNSYDENDHHMSTQTTSGIQANSVVTQQCQTPVSFINTEHDSVQRYMNTCEVGSQTRSNSNYKTVAPTNYSSNCIATQVELGTQSGNNFSSHTQTELSLPSKTTADPSERSACHQLIQDIETQTDLLPLTDWEAPAKSSSMKSSCFTQTSFLDLNKDDDDNFLLQFLDNHTQTD